MLKTAALETTFVIIEIEIKIIMNYRSIIQ